MKGGKSRMQRVKVLASGKYKFVKNLTKSRSKKTKNNPKKRRTKTVARRRRIRRIGRRAKKITFPLATIGGLAAGMAGPVSAAVKGNFEDALNALARNYTGIDPATGTFNVANLTKGLIPLVIGVSISKFVGGSPLNVNRRLAAAGVPFIRI